MNRLSIMGAPISLLLVTVLTHPAEAYHSKRHHHIRPHRHHIAYARPAGCALAHHGRRICAAPYHARRVARFHAVDRRVAGWADPGTNFGAPPDNCALTRSGRHVCIAPYRAPLVASERRFARWADSGMIIGARPDGCPHAYCGCGLRKYLGLSDVRLNLASNWARFFPRVASPRAGLAAVRSHHVMYIEASAGDGLWTIRDYNSGGGLSRVHVRDVRGYVLVDPHVMLARR
jgi:hypothetical protein